MKKSILFTVILVLAAGVAVGYYFGYDHGWEGAGEKFQPQVPQGVESEATEKGDEMTDTVPQVPLKDSTTTSSEPPTGQELSRADIEEILERLQLWNKRKKEQMAQLGGEYRRSVGTYQGREVEEVFLCFGDVCPDNGGFFVRYVGEVDEAACQELNGNPICGYGWTRVCLGCEVRF